MKINNQYQEAEAIYPVTGLYIDPDGNTMEKAEMLLRSIVWTCILMMC